MSAFATVFAGLAPALGSDFLFVTETFACLEGAAFATALDKDLDGADVTLTSVFTLALVFAFGNALDNFSSVLADFVAPVFPTAGFRDADLAKVGTTFFAEGVKGFAGFFIAFAMGSINNTGLRFVHVGAMIRGTRPA